MWALSHGLPSAMIAKDSSWTRLGSGRDRQECVHQEAERESCGNLDIPRRSSRLSLQPTKERQAQQVMCERFAWSSLSWERYWDFALELHLVPTRLFRHVWLCCVALHFFVISEPPKSSSDSDVQVSRANWIFFNAHRYQKGNIENDSTTEEKIDLSWSRAEFRNLP